MFNKDFYPTPVGVITKMFEPITYISKDGTQSYLIKGKRILEPSAGKGDILDYIVNTFGGHWGDNGIKNKCYSLEIEPELCSILKDKQYNILGNDFLDFNTHLTFDLIVMNPPFSKGASHLLKAWDVSKGGKIICLLNESTYTNPYTKERKELKILIDKYGTVDYLGDAFVNSERKTSVNVIIVRLDKPNTNTEDDFIFSGLDEDNFKVGEFKTYNELADRNILKSYELSYKASIEAYKELLQAQSKLNHYRQDICFLQTKRTNNNGDTELVESKTDYAAKFQKYIEESNVEAWKVFLQKSKFTRYLTKKIRKEFDTRFDTQKLISFTEENMVNMLETLFFSQDNLLLDCIEEVFDEMTAYSYNKISEVGWKTNDAWRVNKKVILPNKIRLNYNTFEINWDSNEELNDIDRAMCYVSGLNYENIDTIANSLKQKFIEIQDSGYSTSKNLAESTFFKMRFYKKRTLHLHFKNEYFWQQFNYKVAQKKGFPLPTKMSFDTDYPTFIKN